MTFLPRSGNKLSFDRRNRSKPVRRRPGPNTWWIFRPGCEPMEERTLLSTVNWVGSGTGGDWDVKTNWLDATTGTNHVPTASDEAVINLTSAGFVTLNNGDTDSANSLTANANTSISIGSDSLSLATTSSIGGGLTLTGGTLGGAGTLTVSGLTTWTGGTMSGTGSTNADGGLTIGVAATGDNVVLNARTLNNAGAATLADAAGYGLYLSSGATFNNLAGATFAFTTDASIFSNGGTPSGGTFANAGTLSKTGGTGTSYVNTGITLNDTGTVQASTGTLGLRGGGTISGAAIMTADAGADLDFNAGTYTSTAGSSITGAGTGTISFTGASVTVNGTYSFAGLTYVIAGEVDFNSSASTATLTQVGGTIGGTGTLTVTGLTTWTGGTMSGTGATDANGGLTIGGTSTNTTYHEFLSGWTLNNYGAATLSGFYNTDGLFFTSGATLNNEPGASFDITTDAQLYAFGGSPAGGTINNQGTFAKTGGTGNSIVSNVYNSGSVLFDQSGSGIVEAESGTLSLNGGGTFTGTSSSLAAASGTTLAFSGGTFSIAGVNASGIGTLAVDGAAVTINNGLNDASAILNISSGSLTLNGASTVATLIISGGTLTINGASTAATLTMSGGTLSGTAALTVRGTATWTGGNMSGTGTTIADGGLTLGGTTTNVTYEEFLNGWTLDNYGAATLSTYANDNGLYFSSGGTLNNEAGASFDITTDAQLYAFGGSPAGGTINNQGTFAKTGGTGNSIVSNVYNTGSVLFDQGGSGIVEAESGTLSLNGGGTFSGTSSSLAAASGTTLAFSGGSFSIAGVSASGTGTIAVDGAAVTINNFLDDTSAVLNVSSGSLTLNGASTVATLIISGGTLTINGASTAATLTMSGGTLSGTAALTVTGSTTWTGGTMLGSGTTNADGGLTLGGTATDGTYEEFLSGWTLNNYAAATFASYYNYEGMYFSSGATLNNEAGASFDITADAQLFAYGGSPAGGTINNQGTFAKTGGTGNSIVSYVYNTGSVSFNNSGTLEALSGTLSLNGPFSNFSGTTLTGGSYIVATTLEFNNAAIDTDAANITLQGSSAQIIDQNGHNALTGLASITTAGSFASLGGPTVSVTGNLDNAGILQLSPGSFNIAGNYTQESTGAFDVGLGGTIAGSQFGQLDVTGTASLNGALNVSLVNSFTPSIGNSFEVIPFASSSGSFATYTGLLLSGGLSLTPQFNPTNFSLVTSGLVNTTTTLTAAPSPSVYGQVVTFTATVTSNTPDLPTPTGTVEFIDGGNELGTGALTNGTATFNTSALTVGTHTLITAEFLGDDNFTGSTSADLFQRVNQASTNTSISPSTTSTIYGQPITFTATVGAVAPGAGTATGTVEFFDGTTEIGTGTLDNTATTTFTTTTLPAGSNAITAQYLGDANFTGSTSPVLTQLVGQASTTTAVGSSLNPSIYGQSVTFTATISVVAPGAGSPTGTVEFFDGTTQIGSGGVSGGTASFSTTSLIAGAHSITAEYLGDNNFTGGTSSAISQTVNQASTTTTVASSVNPSYLGQSVTFTATVAVESPGAGTPTGTVEFFDGSTELGTGTLGSGNTATYSTARLAVGSHSITAEYLGDGNFTGGTSSSLSQTVDQGGTTTALTASPNPSVYGQSVTFTATVSALTSGLPTPTGTVEFFDGSTELGTATLSSGVATFPSTSLTTGANSITAQYLGDTNFSGSTSPPVTQTVNQASTTTALVATPNPSVFGQTVSFIATVSPVAPGGGTPTGNVQFYNAVSRIGTVALVNGVATLTFSILPVGSTPVTAYYLGDTNFTVSQSTMVTQTVNPASTSTTLTSSLNPSTFGQSVTFTATVSAVAPGAGTPIGTVEFLDGTTVLDTESLNGSGIATFTTSSLAIGTHSITTVYSGNNDFNGDTSPVLTQVVVAATTTTALASSIDPSVFGQSVTFTATVSVVPPGTGTPTGTVEFFDGTTLVDTETLSTAGTAAFTTASLSVGSHPITAEYLSNNNFSNSTSPVVTQTVNQAGTTTTVTSTVSPSVYGQSVSFTATIAVVAPGAGNPAGTVEFFDGSTEIGSESVSSGAAVLTTTALAVGGHSITAEYLGDPNFVSSLSAPITQTVNQASTTSTVSSSINPSDFGQSVIFTASVDAVAPGSGVPTGSVEFFDGTTGLDTFTLSGGAASFSISSLDVGMHSITAQYFGDTNFTGDTSSVLSQTVVPANTTTALASSIDPTVFGQSVTFTATVAVIAPGSGTPTGSVEFFDGTALLDTETLSNSGTAAFSTSSLSVGTHSITAEYFSNNDFGNSTSPIVSQTVDQASTITTVSSSASPSVYGQSVTFTAIIGVITPGAGTPTGTVEFFDASTEIGSEPVSGNSAVFTTTSLALGDHSITAEYFGDTSFIGSTSTPITQTVNQASTTTTVSSSLNPSGFGQSVTLTASVDAVAPGAGIPTGSVEFFDGTTGLGTFPLASGAASFSISTLAVGMHSITAQYFGDTNFTGDTSPALTQTVESVNTTTVVSSSLNPSFFGQSVTLTAVVSPVSSGLPTPTGTVEFLDGTTDLGTANLSGGVAILTTSSFSSGANSITAVYNGDSTFSGSTSPAITQIVNLNGEVFNDLKGSGVLDPGDPGLSGWTINVVDSSNQIVATTTTDTNGDYSFTGVGPGTYSIQEVVQTNYVPTTPTSITVTTIGGSSPSVLNFGDHYAPFLTPAATLDNGQWGFTSRGTWTTQEGGFNGTYLTTPASTSATYAQWRLSVPAGKYDVWVTWVAAPVDATNAPYQVSDSGTVLGTVAENQQQAPFDGRYGGVYWVDLGSFNFTTDLAYIRLSANANGNLSADGVLLVGSITGIEITAGSHPGGSAQAIGLDPQATDTVTTHRDTRHPATFSPSPLGNSIPGVPRTRVVITQKATSTQSIPRLLKSESQESPTGQGEARASMEDLLGLVAAEVISAGKRKK